MRHFRLNLTLATPSDNEDEDLGVELYEANADLTGWNKLTLDDNDNVQSNRCN